ncbi:hypothetical protein PAMA_002801 [Pampus argenteus]
MLKDCESGSRSRGSQKGKTTPAAVVVDAPASTQTELAVVLHELQSLRTTVVAINTKIGTLDGFGAKLDNVERRIAMINSTVDAVQKSFVDLQQDITANAKRLAEAEGRIGDAEDSLQSVTVKLTDAAKRIAYLESKMEDRDRRKNATRKKSGLLETFSLHRNIQFERIQNPGWSDSGSFCDSLMVSLPKILKKMD